MSLQDTIEDLKKQIAEEEKKENGEPAEAIEEEKQEEAVEEEKEEEKIEEPAEKPGDKKEEPAHEEKTEEEKPDSAAFQRLRREAAAAKKRAEEAERRLAEQNSRKPKEDQTEEAAAPQLNNEEMAEVIHAHRLTRAEREFQTMEAEFKPSVPDYDRVASDYAAALAQSIRIQNPRMTSIEIGEATKNAILRKAAQHLSNGFNPVEEMYHDAKELLASMRGPRETVKEEPEAKEDKPVKPDMKKVAANRQKSSGMTASNGKAEVGISRAYIEQNGITTAEYMKLPAEERRRLMYGA